MNKRWYVVPCMILCNMMYANSASNDVLNTLDKDQLVQVIQLITLAQQQAFVPVAAPCGAPAPLPYNNPNDTNPHNNVNAECAHFILETCSQLASVAIAKDPQVTIRGITNIVHSLISFITAQRHMSTRSINPTHRLKAVVSGAPEKACPFSGDILDDEKLTRYELLNHLLRLLEELEAECENLTVQV